MFISMLWTVLDVILKIILGAIALCVLAFVLLMGGCLALGTIANVSNSIQDAQGYAALEQARHAPLPPHVQRLVEGEYVTLYDGDDPRFDSITSSDGALSRDPNGRYMLTSEGLFDFAAAKLTKLDCPGPPATSGSRINFRRLWLDEQLFLWGRCVYDVTTLQPGPIEDVQCGERSVGCQGNNLTAVIAALARQADRVYQNDREFLFVKLPVGAPAQVWSVYPMDRIAQNSELGHTPLKVPRQKSQASGLRAHSSISPNGEYDASFDLTALTIRRVTNGMLVAQVSFKNSTAGPALFGQGDDILGWTYDSRQVVFLVEGRFGRYGRLYQIFALTIP
jgi:hypothetical protein